MARGATASSSRLSTTTRPGAAITSQKSSFSDVPANASAAPAIGSPPPSTNVVAVGAGASSGAVGSASAQPPSSAARDRKSTRLNSSHVKISYAVFCLKKKNQELKAHIVKAGYYSMQSPPRQSHKEHTQN